jgi:protein gp37
MSATSNIEWTNATVNFWHGCTKVGPGCDHCYAETMDARFGKSHWGQGIERKKIKSAVGLLHRLDNSYADWAADAAVANGNARAFGMPDPRVPRRRRVFIQSMSDLFDLEVPPEWFAEAWRAITICDRLDIQIVTKRVSAIEKRLTEIDAKSWPSHAGLLVTVVTQAEADRDIPRLLALKSKLRIPWVGVSAEPLLGPIDLTKIAFPVGFIEAAGGFLPGLDWVIIGGESGPRARPYDLEWGRNIIAQCKAANVPVFHKQIGSHPVDSARPCAPVDHPLRLKPAHRKGGNPMEWPAELRVREFPVVANLMVAA